MNQCITLVIHYLPIRIGELMGGFCLAGLNGIR